jgi:hypothetical protein
MGDVSIEIAKELDRAFREKDFSSKDSIIRLNGQGAYVFEWRSDDLTIKGEILQEDSIGVLLQSLTLEKNVPDAVTTSYLQQVATKIEQRVNYLQEPLKLIELDPNANAVQMRSESPEVSEGTISYFELLLKSGAWFGHRNRLTLHRYSHLPESERERRTIAFPVTKRQLERLLDDLIEVV